MEKRYSHQKTEQKIYQLWEEGGYFTPQIDPKKRPFVITLPPPNVTGGLHAGHAMYVVEDIMIRYHRMRGEPTLWLPGFDHASIAVEYLVTKQLAKEGKTKHEVGRKEFLKKAHQFASESRQYIREQLKKLGFSLDWTREAYTMDGERSRAVIEAFNHLYQKGLIYKGPYIINWCPQCQTAISDLENVHREEKGKLYFIKYGPITIATTRPETMFADVAVAVHPEDKRYQHLVGQTTPLPLTKRQIPIIADKAVDPKFGTGALKITPAHDQCDFEIGERHHLEKLTVIGPDGRLTKLAGKYAGLSVEKAREEVVKDLSEQGLLEKVETLTHSVGHCQRCGTTTEPLISEQWFVDTNSKFKIQNPKLKKLLGVEEASLAEIGILAVKRGHIKIIPKRFEKIYFHWLENIRDWCISRQLWWGHKIPIEGEEDILDTWFSSSLWPISVFGWPEKTKDFRYFYPTSIRETGYDILFFWVAREIMMCLEMTGQVPFKTVYLHGLVRDEKGRKFSKTAGIGFDPLEMIEKYGADALRMTLIVGNAPGNDIRIGQEKIIAYRNFANKVWNIGRFILGSLESQGYKEHRNLPPYTSTLEGLTAEDRRIIADFNKLAETVTNLLEKYRLDLAADKIYHYIWHRFADEYIEYSKERIKAGDKTVLTVLRYIYLNCLKLLHPFMPFVTEEIWQRFPQKRKEPLIVSQWPYP